MTDENEITEMWKNIRATQQNRRSNRLQRRISRIESWGIPFRRLNGDYHLRFELECGKVVDYWPIHSVIVIKVKGRKRKKCHGMKRLKQEVKP